MKCVAEAGTLRWGPSSPVLGQRTGAGPAERVKAARVSGRPRSRVHRNGEVSAGSQAPVRLRQVAAEGASGQTATLRRGEKRGRGCAPAALGWRRENVENQHTHSGRSQPWRY